MNPFTRKPATITAPTGTFRVDADGTPLGAIDTSDDFEEDGLLRVHAPGAASQELRRLVESIAARLGADIEWMNL